MRRPRSEAVKGIWLGAASAVLLAIAPLASANVPGVQIMVQPADPTTSSSATFEFANSLDAGALFECQLDSAPFSPCLTPFTATALSDGSHTFTVRDAAQTSDEDSFTWVIDTKPASSQTVYLTRPEVVRRLTARPGDRSVVLNWAKPVATNLAAVEIRRSDSSDPVARVVYRGLRRTFKSSGLRNGVTYRFVLVNIDRNGNASQPIVVSATPKPMLLASPKPGAQVTRPPLLRWVPDTKAGYFNVQLYRNGMKILSAWPNVVRFQLSSRWFYERHTFTLKPGVYTWFVWPGIGSREDVKYGELLGRSNFVVVAPKRP